MSNQKELSSQKFVSVIIGLVNKDKGIAARLRRADSDNPGISNQSWGYLAEAGTDLENLNQCLLCSTVAAAIARSKDADGKITNGNFGIGQALASYYRKNQNDPAKIKLRRLLACDSVSEICRILRPILSLIKSKNTDKLDFVKLLDNLLKFQWDEARQKVKLQWAKDFYRFFSDSDEQKDAE